LIKGISIKKMLAKKRMAIAPRPMSFRQMERHLKGVANHRRIEILFLVAERNGITLDGLCQATGGNSKTLSEHTKKLAQAGLINKAYIGRGVAHSISPYGRRFLKFIQSF